MVVAVVVVGVQVQEVALLAQFRDDHVEPLILCLCSPLDNRIQVMDALVIYISSANRTYGIDLTPVANYEYNGDIVNGSTSFFTYVEDGCTCT